GRHVRVRARRRRPARQPHPIAVLLVPLCRTCACGSIDHEEDRSMTGPSDLGWLLDTFNDRVPDVSHALAISVDGLVLAHTRRLPRDRADQLAATGSGLVALLAGAARFFEAGQVISN